MIIIAILLRLYEVILIVRILMSWVNPDPRNGIVRFLYSATEPVLFRVRRLLPYLGGIDFSPLVVILVIYFLQSFLVGTLQDLAVRMR